MGYGPAAPAGLFQLRAMECHAIAQDMFTYNAAVSACDKGQLPQLALHVLSAMKRNAIAQDLITLTQSSVRAIWARRASRPYTCC